MPSTRLRGHDPWLAWRDRDSDGFRLRERGRGRWLRRVPLERTRSESGAGARGVLERSPSGRVRRAMAALERLIEGWLGAVVI